MELMQISGVRRLAAGRRCRHAGMFSSRGGEAAREDASAVVTGAARGIGRAVAERLVRHGYHVVVTDQDGEAVRRTAAEIGAVAGVEHDVRVEASHVDVAREAQRHGPVRVWVNNAGVGHDGTLSELSTAAVEQLVQVNLMGVIWGMRAAIDAFGSAPGRVVNVASLSGLGPVPGLSVYAATKAAVVSLSASAQAETGRDVRVSALCPDGVDTALVDGMRPDGRAKALVHSGGGLLTVEDVADAAIRLLAGSRVVRSVPAWRAGLMRFTSVTPSVSTRAVGLFEWAGRRRLRRR